MVLFLAPMWMAALGVKVCPWAITLRMPCPGCGLTRVGLAMFQGDLVEAYHHNPIGIVVVPFYLLGLGWFVARYVVTGEGRMRPWFGIAVAIMGIGLFAVWIARFFGAFGGPVAV